MPWGPQYEEQGPSWADRLIQLANVVTDIRERNKKDKQQKLENERRATIDKQNLEKGALEIADTKATQERRKGYEATVGKKKPGSGLLGEAPGPQLNVSGHWEDESLTDPALRDSLGVGKSPAPILGAAKPSAVEDFSNTLEETAPFVEPKMYLSGKKDLAEMQNKAEKTKQKIFEDLSPQDKNEIYKIAERRAKGIDPPDQYIKDFPAFGKNGSVRAIVDNLTYEINPDFNAYEGTIGYGAKRAEANKSATLTPDIRGKEAALSYGKTTATEQAQRDIQKTNPMLTGEGAIKISQSAMAIKNLQRLKDNLEKGNIDYFDIIKKTGQFKNPEVNNAFQQVSEIVGRQQSGAAIANHEWANFGKEVLNRNFLLTEQGRKTALENIDDYLDRFHSVGILQTSDEDWYNKQNERVKSAREKSYTPSVQTKVINGTTYKKVPGGWEPQ